MKHKIISLDPPFGPNISQCFIHSSQSSTTFLHLESGANEIILTPAISYSTGISDENVIVVQPVIAELLNDDFKITISFAKAATQCPPFSLEFIQWKKYENYDDVPVGIYRVPGSFSNTWPSALSHDMTNILIQSLLINCHAAQGSIVAIEVHDSVMVFRVLFDISAAWEREDIFKLDPTQLQHIHITRALARNKRTEQEALPLDCFQTPLHTILFSMEFIQSGQSTHAFNSFLVSAPEGAGKSSLLSLLRHRTAIAWDTLHIDIQHLQVASTTISSMLATLQSPHGLQVLPLLNLMFALAGDCTHRDAALDKPLLITFDNIDALMLTPAWKYTFEDISDQHLASTPALDEDTTLLVAYVLARLLQQLDNKHLSPAPTPHVVVVATTRLPINKLPTMNNGAPRFEKILSIPRPTRRDREILIDKALATMRLVETLQAPGCHPWAQAAAHLCPGFLPGDIQMTIIKLQCLQKGDILRNTSDPASAVVSWRDILTALSLTRPKQLESIKEFLRYDQDDSVAALTWNDFVGYPQLKADAQRLLKQMSSLPNESALEAALHRQNAGIVIHGDTGVGKSYLANVIGQASKIPFRKVRCTELLSKYFGETEANIRLVFQFATPPCILFFDEFDAFAHKRSDADESNGLNNRILSTFLNELDGAMQKKNEEEGVVTVMVACSSIEALDEALLRPGRLSQHLLITPPSAEDIAELLRYNLVGIPVAEGIDLDKIAHSLISKRPSCADVHFICKQAIMNTIRDAVRDQINDQDAFVTDINFTNAMKERYGDSAVFSMSQFTFHIGTNS